MSLTQRKSRPLERNKDSYRDDRLFIVACDDSYAPRQYFNFFKIPRIQVHVVATPTDENTCHAKDVLTRLKNIEYEPHDERWMFLDTDHYTEGSHIKNFNLAIKEAKDVGVKVALSKPCFELWLLLHHVNDTDVVALPNAKEVEKLLRKTLGEYNKTHLKQEHFPLASVKYACDQSKRLDCQNTDTIPASNTSRVYQFWESLVENISPSQLLTELSEILK